MSENPYMNTSTQARIAASMAKMQDQLVIGISSCLMGEKVRFDGGHKRSPYCKEELGKYFKFEMVCPEMAIGLGAPRPSIRLVNQPEGQRLQSANGKIDVTEEMQAFSERAVEKLGHLSGYIVCPKSPTCGMERVLEYKAGTNNATKTGVGVYTRILQQRYPQLPIEESGRLHDLPIRENFFTRVYAYHDWQQMQAKGLTKHSLMQFHTRYKYLIMAHSPQAYKTLGRLIANVSTEELGAVAQDYFCQFMHALRNIATRRNHTNTLQHIQGYFKKLLNAEEKAELTEAILAYHDGLQPLLVPITLINHYLRLNSVPYIEGQVYLQPHPQALRLRYGA